MNAQSLYTFFVSLSNHSLKVINVRVNVTVRNKTHKVESSSLVLNILYKLLPYSAFKHAARRNRFTNKLSTLSKNTTTTHSIVTNLRVTHIIISRKTNSSSVSLKLSVRAVSSKPVQVLHLRSLNCISLFILTISNAVHNNQDNRTTTPLPFRVLFQCMHCVCHIFNLL